MDGRIIIIDDMVFNGEIMELICRDAGYNDVKYFSDPITAVEEITRGKRPDLVITDYNMPELTGTRVIQELEKHFGELNAVIVTSAPENVVFHGKKYPILEKGAGFRENILKLLQ